MRPQLLQKTSCEPDVVTERGMQDRVILRPSAPEDRRRIGDLILGSGLFHATDAECVDEMFGLALAKPTPDNYRFLSAWLDGDMVGFACYGWESLTDRTWDLFWILTSPEARRRGVGSALLAEAVRVAWVEGGRLMVIFTSSTAPYAAARQLYESQGFVRQAIVPEYYKPEDDLYIYSRRLQG
jgi:ribosomal protein S18 acetylase RimI-like enzyme